jgi:ABC-type uncharacterized transport system permease subunit
MSIQDYSDTILSSGVRLTIPLAFAACGEYVAQRAGTLNISVEGMLLGSAFTSVATASATGSATIGLVTGLLTGLVIGAVHGNLSHRIRHRSRDQRSGAGPDELPDRDERVRDPPGLEVVDSAPARHSLRR